MATITMTTRDKAYDEDGNLRPNIKVVTDYRGAEEGVHHGDDCPHRTRRNGTDKALTPECSERCEVFGPLFMQTLNVGLVLSTGERNGYHDSDFFAVVWNAEQGRPVEFTYASTRGWTYPNSASVDATDEVRAAYQAYRDNQDRIYREQLAVRREEAAREEALQPKKGYRCRVVKGRKVPVGTVGEVFWYGPGNYGDRVGLREDDGTTHWTAASNVQRILPDLDEMPEGIDSWQDFVREERESLPYVGQRWATRDGTVTGEVIWVSDERDRLGIRSGKGKEDVTWVDTSQAERA